VALPPATPKIPPIITPKPLVSTPTQSQNAQTPIQSIATVNGAQVEVRIDPVNTNTGLKVTAPDWDLTIDAVIAPNAAPGTNPTTAPDSSSQVSKSTNNLSLDVKAGSSMQTQGSGFLPDSPVSVYIFSTPILLGTFTVDSTGKFNGSLPIPAGLDLGQHHIQVNGYSPDSQVRSATLPITIIGTNLTLKVFFGLNSSQILGKERLNLISFASKLRSTLNAKSKITIVGFSQPTPVDPYPKALSLSRASATAKILKGLKLQGTYKISGNGQAPKNKASSRYVLIQVTR